MAGAIILYRLVFFRFRVHDKWSMTHYRLTQLLCGNQQQAGADVDPAATRIMSPFDRTARSPRLICVVAMPHSAGQHIGHGL